ncbi:MAG: ketoacyl-ACP synthase III [Deltaproteobacteria bacterium]|nr:ketoacyl-ACP synthase III [Deltaproteobacteria bacterium]
MENKSKIESIGVKLPERCVTPRDIISKLKIFNPPNLERISGIKERRFCAENEDSYTLAVDAVKDCLSRSKYKPEAIDMVVCCSISRNKDGLTTVFEPPLSLFIKENIGAPKALNFDIANACAGMLTGIYIVDSFIKQGIIKTGLVVSGEYISNLSETAVNRIRTATSSQLASLTLGDAGAAIVMEKTDQSDSQALKVSGFTTFSHYNNLCIGRQCHTSPGGIMNTKRRKLHSAAILELPKILKAALLDSNLSFSQIDYFIPHQTSITAIKVGMQKMVKKLKGSPGETVTNLERFGNTASTSHILALHRYLQEKRIKKGSNILMTALASGLVIGCVIFSIKDLILTYGNTN